MLICSASLLFYSFAHKISKIHFFMSEKGRNHSNFLKKFFIKLFFESHLVFAFFFYLGLLEGGQAWQTHLEVFPCLWLWPGKLKICYLHPILNSLRENKLKILSRTIFACFWWGMVRNKKVTLTAAFRELPECLA